MDILDLYLEYLKSDGISTDTRTIKPNQLFFALKGEKIDGNEFAIQAIASGARCAVVSDKSLSLKNPKCIFFRDTLFALQELAICHRKKLTIPILGITGSVAKTTSKELISAILASRFNVFATKGNLNNHIGVPLSILSIDQKVDIAVIEMGANHIGEIWNLCKIAQPTHGLITRIGRAHLEGFGSQEGIIIAKSDLYRYLRDHSGLAFINDADPILMNIQKGFEMRKVYVHDQIQYTLVSADPFIHIDVKINDTVQQIKTSFTGKYNVENLIAAISIGHYFNIPLDKIKKSLESYVPKSNRSELLKMGTTEYILDAYNANPTSMAEAIKSLVDYKTDKNKMLALGEMKEMGDSSLEVHQEIIDLISTHKNTFTHIILVGSVFSKINTQKIEANIFENIQQAKEWFNSVPKENSVVLLKGSRSMTMEKLLDGIKTD